VLYSGRIPRSKDSRRLHVDVDLGLLKLVGIYTGLPCVTRLYYSGRMARSMDVWTGIPSHAHLSPPSLQNACVRIAQYFVEYFHGY